MQTVWDREMCAICEMHENARYLKHEMRKICKNTKIAKITVLQQVQYKVLRYGLYVPIET